MDTFNTIIGLLSIVLLCIGLGVYIKDLIDQKAAMKILLKAKEAKETEVANAKKNSVAGNAKRMSELIRARLGKSKKN